ncbi:MAG: amidohydrolase [Gammaproteobacteria bacterium]|nr:amidohydrolase [Gammaproteobacteria bacterium]
MLNYLYKTIFYTAFLCAFCGAATAETVLHSVNGYTTSSDGIRQFSVLVFDDAGKVVATGGDELLAGKSGEGRVDGGGLTVLPGLIDAHAHVYGLGLLKSRLDITGIRSVQDAARRIGIYAKEHPHALWILGRGWNQVLWPVREFPTAAHIDAVVSDRPVWLRRIDGHAGWANSAAMKLAGIDNDTPDPVGGKILRDDNGQATGVFIDLAMDLIERQLPKPEKSDYRQALKSAVHALVAEGMTSVHDAGIDLMNAEVYISMADNDELDMRIYAMTGGAGEVLDAIGKPLHGYGNDRLEIAAVKLYADGALGSRGAAMIEPYSDDAENRGLAFWTQDELNRMLAKANDMGFQVGIHAIGDLGNRMALDAFDKVQNGKPSELRNRVEHAQIIALDDIPRFAELGVIASMQPTHATSDKNMAEDRIGPDRILGGYAWRRLLDSGAVIASGSDFPVELSNPFHGLYAAVTRQGRDGEPKNGWYADQALTRAEALHSFTLAAAYAANQEDRLGSLEPGKWADFIIIDRDYFTVPASEIDDIQVLQTWVGGEKVYDANMETKDR